MPAFPDRFLVIGHRGVRGAIAENTLGAIAAALSAGAHGVELDVRRAGDGTLVVFHDEDLSRLAGKAHLVATLSLAELKDVELAGGGRVPTLDEALRLVAARGALLDLELKEADLVEDAATVVHRHGLAAGTVMSAFTADWLEPARELGFPVGLITQRKGADPLEEAHRRGFEFLAPSEEQASRALIEAAARLGIAVVPWTVNDATAALRLKALGAAGIITDRPAELVPRLRDG